MLVTRIICTASSPDSDVDGETQRPTVHERAHQCLAELDIAAYRRPETQRRPGNAYGERPYAIDPARLAGAKRQPPRNCHRRGQSNAGGEASDGYRHGPVSGGPAGCIGIAIPVRSPPRAEANDPR